MSNYSDGLSEVGFNHLNNSARLTSGAVAPSFTAPQAQLAFTATTATIANSLSPRAIEELYILLKDRLAQELIGQIVVALGKGVTPSLLP